MTTINVQTSRGYEVQIGAGLLSQVGAQMQRLLPKARMTAVVTDSTVGPLYLAAVMQSLEPYFLHAVSFEFTAGEQSKNGETYLRLLETLAAHQMTRSDVLIALGGGVVGDLCGFAAATYLRGVSYIQLPTTLLAMVDSSVGGKTAIDLQAGKNLAGAFYQPSLVLCDTDSLRTLSEEVFSDGCAEVIKYGMLGSRELLEQLLMGPFWEQPEAVITQCISMKRDIVERDEFDTGERQLLNLGHTIGHAIERCSGYELSHGRAVAIGMAVMTRAAVGKRLCPPTCQLWLERLLTQFGLPDQSAYPPEKLYQAALGDKKRQGEELTIVVPTALGSSELMTIPVEQLLQWIEVGLKP